MTNPNLHIPAFMTRTGPTKINSSPAKPAPAHPRPDRPLGQISVLTFAQLTNKEPWLLEQLHLRNHHILLWTTRGQGRVLLHGLRRGFGAHNAIFIPAGKLLAFELGLQVQGQALLIPDDGRVGLPDRTQHLRLSDGQTQAELTSIFDAMRREIHEERPFLSEALNAHAQLMSITLRRLVQTADPTPPARAAERLVRRFCDLLSKDFRTGQPMATYAEALDITPTHLTRVCRQCAGLTAAEMLSQTVQHATRSMLISGDMAMQDIAASLGFKSAAYFTRFCQQNFGHSPSQIRKNARGG